MKIHSDNSIGGVLRPPNGVKCEIYFRKVCDVEMIDVTYCGKLTTLINVVEKQKLSVNYTIDGKSGLPTTISILIKDSAKDFLMITFDYQELKRIVEN